MPKIDFNYAFKNLDGKVIPEGEDEVEKDKEGKEIIKKKSPDFTLKTASVNVLLNPGLEDITCPQCRAQLKKMEEISGEEKCKRFMLATKIYSGDGSVDIGTKDVELLKELIAKSYPPITVGQSWNTLDPEGAKEREKE